jgi:hypothetical protein
MKKLVLICASLSFFIACQNPEELEPQQDSLGFICNAALSPLKNLGKDQFNLLLTRFGLPSDQFKILKYPAFSQDFPVVTLTSDPALGPIKVVGLYDVVMDFRFSDEKCKTLEVETKWSNPVNISIPITWTALGFSLDDEIFYKIGFLRILLKEKTSINILKAQFKLTIEDIVVEMKDTAIESNWYSDYFGLSTFVEEKIRNELTAKLKNLSIVCKLGKGCDIE